MGIWVSDYRELTYPDSNPVQRCSLHGRAIFRMSPIPSMYSTSTEAEISITVGRIHSPTEKMKLMIS
ncbi:predicted protein [Botrytis cinerea T4]|uniref:Uncharacterized protein n=1 Tax=Botryotinia fuckeliana (strain T4) TaxID=999810 RepID=G2XQ10_BOTF4|nr:predicted protein [Botrytis cinerea T4]